MPSLMHSPSTISSTSQALKISILRLDIPMPADNNHCFHVTFPQGTGTLQGHFPHLQCPIDPWPRSPSRSHHLRLQIPVLPASWATFLHYSISESELDTTCIKSPVSPSLSRISEIFPSVPTHIIQPSAHPPSKCIPPRAGTLSSPAFLHSPTDSAPAPPPPQCIIVSTPYAFEHGSPNSRRTRALRSISRSSWCPAFPAAHSRPHPEVLQRRRETRSPSYARAVHLAALVTTLTLRANPPAHGPSFVLALALALHSMRALSARYRPSMQSCSPQHRVRSYISHYSPTRFPTHSLTTFFFRGASPRASYPPRAAPFRRCTSCSA
ncbi:hypothetical protein EDB83DRAFT_330931 [Lactarius deliciosus]|nr:hypothetical protein EDB83DRAFT_330931 [Lactarius deliciosus]